MIEHTQLLYASCPHAITKDENKHVIKHNNT